MVAYYISVLFFAYICDDIVISDSGWPNSLKIVPLTITGAGSYNQFSPIPLANPNWECVNEVPQNTTDYVKPTAGAQKEAYALSNLPAEAHTIKAINWCSTFRRVGNPSLLTFKPFFKSGVLEAEGATLAASRIMDTSYQQILAVSPITLGDWDVTEVNNMEAGIVSAA